MKASFPYTCGELVQGRLDGADFHITCPIRRRGTVEAEWAAAASPRAPRLPPKARAAAARVLEARGCARMKSALRIQLRGRAAAGKGLASSSVDVLGVIAAVSALLGSPAGAAEASRIAVAVEPTDGIAWPGIVLFDHRRGQRRQLVGRALPLAILVFEPPDGIETVAFNRRSDRGRLEDGATLWSEAVAMVGEGLATGDEALVAAAATLSALHWQRVLRNPWIEPLLRWGARHGALGVCRAHSGSVVGVLFASGRCLRAPAAVLRRIAPPAARVWTTRLANGGGVVPAGSLP